MISHYRLTVGLKCSEERGEEGATDADVDQLWQGIQAQLGGEVIQQRVRVLPLVFLHQSDQVLKGSSWDITLKYEIQNNLADIFSFNVGPVTNSCRSW